jgi:ribosome biogenesis protein Nip4
LQAQEARGLRLKQITDFVSQFGTSLELDENLITGKQGRFFLLSKSLKETISKDFFYAGIYLGKCRQGVFFPSFNLLAMIAKRKEANKVMVDEKSEWLFIVGRDLFKRGILNVTGSRKRGAYTLVVNQHGESLGFGRILHSLDENGKKHQVAVRNISDVGDFLRRERHRE